VPECEIFVVKGLTGLIYYEELAVPGERANEETVKMGGNW
jgi:hypothetical protein